MSRRLEFGPFVLEPDERRLTGVGAPVLLTPKAFDLLVMLVERRGHLVERKELMDALWPGIFVDDGNLSDNVSKLRQALGDDSREPRYIATVAGSGYRFIAEVRAQEGPKKAARTIAILPFRVLGGSAEDAHLGLGVADALITTLSNLHSLVVRPTSAIFRYAASDISSTDAGKEQNAEIVVEGTVQRSANRVRVAVKVLRVADGVAVWASKFDEKLAGIFEVQDAISERIATELVNRLSPEERSLLRKHYTENLEAYELYLQGRFYWNKFTPDAMETAIGFFERAIAIDDRYALAHAGLSVAYAVQGAFGMVPPSSAMLKARHAAERAVAIDDLLAEAHLALAATRLLFDWDWDAAKREAQRAVALNSNCADAHTVLGYHHAATTRFDEALNEFHVAEKLQPRSAVQKMDVGQGYCWSRNYKRAVSSYFAAHQLDPMHVPVPFFVAQSYERNGLPQLAIEECQKALRDTPDHPSILSALASAYRTAGDSDAANRVLEKLHAMAANQYVSSFLIALASPEDEAMVALSRAYAERDPQLTWIGVDPQLERLHGRKDFRALLEKMGLLDVTLNYFEDRTMKLC